LNYQEYFFRITLFLAREVFLGIPPKKSGFATGNFPDLNRESAAQNHFWTAGNAAG
jgi:hypothetical protein